MKDIHGNSKKSYRENERSGKGETYRQKIVNLLTATDTAMTDREILDTLNVTDVNNIRPEITRLKQIGAIEETGKTQCPITNKTVRMVCIKKKFADSLF